MVGKKKMSFGEWLRYGIDEGFCSDRYCENHQAHAYEDEDLFHSLMEEYDGRDFCWPIVRLRTLAEDD